MKNVTNLVMAAWTLDKSRVKSKVDGLMNNVCWLANYHLRLFIIFSSFIQYKLYGINYILDTDLHSSLGVK